MLIIGLGNPGDEYKETRHNTGFIILDYILGNKINWKQSSGTKAVFYKDKIGKKEVEYLKPTTFMNNSGVAVSYTQTKYKIKPKDIIVIYDDIDLPLGTFKISFNRTSGGHNGLESIIKKIKSKEFIRIRIGIAPSTPSGKIRKPKGEDAILKFLLGKLKDSELKELKKISKKISEVLEALVIDGKDKAMSIFN
jgi:PTH1 family peptidyl-tRNA hydrolase